jgi:hypothetical protein
MDPVDVTADQPIAFSCTPDWACSATWPTSAAGPSGQLVFLRDVS